LVEQTGGEFARLAVALFGVELVDEVDNAVEARTLALQDHVAGESCGQVGFPGAGSTDEHDVARRGEVLPGVELADLGLVHHRFAEVEGIQVPRHGEAGQAQLVLVRAGLTISHFRLQQLRKPGGRGKLLLAQRRQALLQSARHAPQPQPLELFDQLSLHRYSPVDGRCS